MTMRPLIPYLMLALAGCGKGPAPGRWSHDAQGGTGASTTSGSTGGDEQATTSGSESTGESSEGSTSTGGASSDGSMLGTTGEIACAIIPTDPSTMDPASCLCMCDGMVSDGEECSGYRCDPPECQANEDDDCTCYGYPAEDGLCDTSGDSTGGSTG